MIVTPTGRSVLSRDELVTISTGVDSPIYKSKIATLVNNSATKVFRYGRLIVKYNTPYLVTREVENSLRLSQVSPVFLPVLAYDTNFFVVPYVEGVLLKDISKNIEVIKQMAYVIATALLKTEIIYEDLHNKNVIVTPSSYHVIDLEFFRPMSDWYNTPPSLKDLADEVFGELMYNEG